MTHIPQLCAHRERPLSRSSTACWQREQSHLTRHRDALTRACAWLGELTRPAPPRLQPEPLWSDCLTELVSDGAEPGPARAAPPSRSPHVRSDSQPKSSHRAADAMPLPVQSAADHPLERPAPPPVGLPRKAPLDALQRHGGRLPAPKRSLRKPTRHAAPISGPQPARRTTEPPARHTARSAWQAQLARRTQARLQPAGSVEPMSSALEMEWKRPLLGNTASAELLHTLARVDGPPQAESRRAKHRRAQKPPLPRQDPPPRRRQALDDAISSPPQHTARGRRAARPTVVPAADEALHTVVGSGHPAPVVVPPHAAPTLPPLHPLAHPAAAELSTAAQAARESATREMETAVVDPTAEDLTELTRQLKRILDAEARRHGIDV